MFSTKNNGSLLVSIMFCCFFYFLRFMKRRPKKLHTSYHPTCSVLKTKFLANSRNLPLGHSRSYILPPFLLPVKNAPESVQFQWAKSPFWDSLPLVRRVPFSPMMYYLVLFFSVSPYPGTSENVNGPFSFLRYVEL
jgi:hypothetical protein